MALILIRAQERRRLYNAISDLIRHAQLNIIGRPKYVNPQLADQWAGKILEEEIRSQANEAAMIKVREETTPSIKKLQRIHPPAHILVLSDEHAGFEDIKNKFVELPYLKGYYPPK